MASNRSSSDVGQWIEERLEIGKYVSYFFNRKVPVGVGWYYTMGSATMVCFILLVVTGIFLAFNYSPSPDHAWDSIQYIQHDVPLGWLVRGIHHWAASGMVVLIFLHGLRVFFMGSYKYPREMTWILGVFLLLLTLGSSFTGYLLPWDEKAYWATTVGTNFAGSVPFLGDFLMKLLRGGTDMGAATLARFFTLHFGVIPPLIAGLLGLHLFMVVRQGISNPPKLKKK